jgi:hypothetical protein
MQCTFATKKMDQRNITSSKKWLVEIKNFQKMCIKRGSLKRSKKRSCYPVQKIAVPPGGGGWTPPGTGPVGEGTTSERIHLEVQEPTVRGPPGSIGGHWHSLAAIGGRCWEFLHKTCRRLGVIMTSNFYGRGTKIIIGGHWHRWCLKTTAEAMPGLKGGI